MRYQLVIFDMDGTLIEELLDFDQIYADIGITQRIGILEYLEHADDAERARAGAILHEHEYGAAGRCELFPRAMETLTTLRAAGVRTALLTRNSPACAALVSQRHNLTFDHTSTRDDRPYKPHPDSILNILRRLNVPREQSLMVGDYIYDIQAAQNAGVDVALVRMPQSQTLPPNTPEPTYRISQLDQLIEIVLHPDQANLIRQQQEQEAQ
jgi:HAD superfamily hydrolase (TIGR01509 family)